MTRSNSACQKDWFEVASHELPDELGIAVTSHQGWDTNLDSESEYALVVVIESIGQQTPIYLPISVALEELVQELDLEIEV